jgi:ubiquinone/menaquinone biosynthesis C-methylase UbiE
MWFAVPQADELRNVYVCRSNRGRMQKGGTDKAMYEKMAAIYDALYDFKDYDAEARILLEIIGEHKRSEGNRLLDVACGTGKHITCLENDFAVMGIDLDPRMIDIARGRLPGVTFEVGDMLEFDLPQRFDIVTCLFSSIGYVKSVGKLHQAIANMTRHLEQGGILIVEPWFSEETYQPGTLHAQFVDRPDLKIARMSISEWEDGVSVIDFHHLVATLGGIEHFVERHELGLFGHIDYLAAFTRAGLETVYDPDGLTGRGLYIGCRPEVPA